MKSITVGAFGAFFIMTCLTMDLRAQAPDAPGELPDPAGAPQRTGNASVPGGYQFPTTQERFRNYLSDSFGPMRLGIVAASAGILHWYDSPPEWNSGFDGYARRLGYSMALHLIKRTEEYGLNEAFHRDSRYYRCDCQGFFPRLGHVIKSSFTARNPEGRDVFSPGWLASNYTGEMIGMYAMYPDRYNYKDAIRQAHWAMLGKAGVDFAREFIFKRRK